MKIFLAFLAITSVALTSYATALSSIVKISDMTEVGLHCENEGYDDSDICSARWYIAKSYCEKKGSRLPTILELASVYFPNLVVMPSSGSDYPLPIKSGLFSVDAFNYDGFTDSQNPLKKLDQFYFANYEGTIANNGPDKVEGRVFWSLSTGVDDGVWAYSDFTKVSTSERVPFVLSFYYPHFDFSFRCVR